MSHSKLLSSSCSSLFPLHSERQRGEEAVWFLLHSSDERGWNHAVRREPRTLRLQGQTSVGELNLCFQNVFISDFFLKILTLF